MIEKVLFLAGINKAVVDMILEPVKKKFPQVDLWWGVYINILTGVGLTLLTNVNALPMVENVLAGKILTGLFVGAGAKVIHDYLDRNIFAEVEGVLLETTGGNNGRSGNTR